MPDVIQDLVSDTGTALGDGTSYATRVSFNAVCEAICNTTLRAV